MKHSRQTRRLGDPSHHLGSYPARWHLRGASVPNPLLRDPSRHSAWLQCVDICDEEPHHNQCHGRSLRIPAARTQHVDICDEHSCRIRCLMTWRVILASHDTLTSAPEHSYRNRASVIISHHLSPYQRVDICDERSRW